MFSSIFFLFPSNVLGKFYRDETYLFETMPMTGVGKERSMCYWFFFLSLFPKILLQGAFFSMTLAESFRGLVAWCSWTCIAHVSAENVCDVSQFFLVMCPSRFLCLLLHFSWCRFSKLDWQKTKLISLHFYTPHKKFILTWGRLAN